MIPFDVLGPQTLNHFDSDHPFIPVYICGRMIDVYIIKPLLL